jgi:ferredoxin-NADP reductase
MPQKFLCEIVDIIDHGERVYSIFLKPEVPAPRFLPGQFLHLALDEYTPGDFWPDSRSFSIASSPADRQLLRITYAVKGQYTGRMETELRRGREVWVKMPYGEFTIDTDRDVCLLAGGTGITAFTGFLASLPPDYSHQVSLFYGARRPELLIYRQLVESSLQVYKGLRVSFLAEQDTPGTDCIPGRINVDNIWKVVPDPLRTTYYLAGPPEMIRALVPALGQRGVEPGRIVVDAWE